MAPPRITANPLPTASAPIKVDSGPQPNQIKVENLKEFHQELARAAASNSKLYHRNSESSWWNQSPLLLNPIGWLFSLSGCSSQSDEVGDAEGGEVENTPPFFRGLVDQKVEVGQELRFNLYVNDADNDDVEVHMGPSAGQPYPEEAELTQLTDNMYEFLWAPQQELPGGRWHVTFTANDGLNEINKTIRISVLPRGSVENFCDSPQLNKGEGTPDSPFEFSILVYVEDETRQIAEDNGWDIEKAVANNIAGINTCFNNGQLAHSYEYNLMGIQYPILDNKAADWPPSASDTPENEDLLIIYDHRYVKHEGTYGGRRTIIGPIYNLNSTIENDSRVHCHETGHLLSAPDLYTNYVKPSQNLVYPGASYDGKIKDIMGTGSLDDGWSTFSAGFINYAEGDPNLSTCAGYWVQGWVPETIKIKVTDDLGEPIANATVDFYRKTPSRDLDTNDLWLTSMTNSNGEFILPEGILHNNFSTGLMYSAFLAAVKLGGESYLNWYKHSDIVEPYHRGETEVILPAVVSEETLYTEPEWITTDLMVDYLSGSPTNITAGEKLERKLAIRNIGPDPYVGEIGIQFFLSTDSIHNLDDDKPVGGWSPMVEIEPDGVFNYDGSNTIPASLAAGSYYFLVEVKPKLYGATDPDEENNIMAAEEMVTVTTP